MSKEIKAPNGQAAGRDIVNQTGNVLHVRFGANHGGQQFIANEPVHIHMAPASPTPRITVVMQQTDEHVSEEQKVRLKELVAEVVRLEGLLKRTPKSFASVWVAVNTKCRATSYHLIKQANYAKAEKFLREWIGRLSSAKSAPAKDSDWRNRKYRYIFTNVRQLDGEAALRTYLQNRFATDSMKGLSDTDLETVYRLVAGWKKVGHAPGQASA